MRSLFPTASILSVLLSISAVAQDHDRDWDKSRIQHVLLISIDGMHAVDFKNCVEGIAGANGGKPYCPNLAALGTTGVNYVAANTSKPSVTPWSWPETPALRKACSNMSNRRTPEVSV